MKYIISGSNRSGSRSLTVAKIIQGIYKESGEDVEIIALDQLPLHELGPGTYGKGVPPSIKAVVEKLNRAEGLHLVVPEYNGSYPGALKLFIDHWSYPETFEQRPICFVGIGLGPFGGLRPVEHLQQVFGYRNGFILPHRVFLRDASKNLEGMTIKDPVTQTLLVQQVHGFQRFTKALQSVRLDANSILEDKALPLKDS